MLELFGVLSLFFAVLFSISTHTSKLTSYILMAFISLPLPRTVTDPVSGCYRIFPIWIPHWNSKLNRTEFIISSSSKPILFFFFFCVSCLSHCSLIPLDCQSHSIFSNIHIQVSLSFLYSSSTSCDSSLGSHHIGINFLLGFPFFQFPTLSHDCILWLVL